MHDLVLLVPDKNTEFTIRGALGRHQALGIRQIDFQILVEQGGDGGVRRRGAQVLKVVRGRFSHAAMVMDYEGSGADVGPAELEAQLDGALSDSWDDRAKAIVIQLGACLSNPNTLLVGRLRRRNSQGFCAAARL